MILQTLGAAALLGLAALSTALFGEEPERAPLNPPSAMAPLRSVAASAAGNQASACISFRDATTFKTVDGDTIRLTAGGTDFDFDLVGEQCMALDKEKGLAIQSAPRFPVCIGTPGVYRLQLKSDGRSEPIRCSIAEVRVADPNAAKRAAEEAKQ